MKASIPFFDLKAQYRSLQPELDEAIRTVFQGGQFIGGAFVEKFESEFSGRLGVKHCLGVGNGTDAILIALKCLGVRTGDEVITPAFGWISASEMISLTGAKPVFADVLPDGTVDPAKLEALITPRTKGVIAVHLYGQAAHAETIKKICDQHGLFFLEDCAQAHLTTEHNKIAGTIGTVGTFSFYPTKNLGAYGDGGCVVTNNENLASAMRLFANHGGVHDHHHEGINSRLDSLQAGILSVKLRHLAKWTNARIEHARLYSERLSEVSEIDLPVIREGTRHTFHQFVIRTRQRDALRKYLDDRGIQTLIHYPEALHNLPAYRHFGHRESDFPVASKCGEEVLSLPVYPELLQEDIQRVADTVTSFYGVKS